MISIVIPTNKPIDYVYNVVNSILLATKDNFDYEILIVTDEDSEEYRSCRNWKMTRHIVSENPGAINGWNTGLKESRGNLLVIGADDIRFHRGWDFYAMKAHHEKLNDYGVIGFNDLHNDGENHTTHFLFDRAFCLEKLGGVMAYPVYNFFCNDTEIMARAKLANAYYYCKDAIVEHLHPSNGKRPIVGDEANRSEAMEHDIKLFYERKAKGFPNNFEPVLK